MSHNTLAHRALRPAVRALAATPVTPDVLTALRLATGLGAAWCFASHHGLMSAGAGLFLLSMLLDRADGELARQTRRFSRIGGNFDLTADCISTMAIFIGLGIGAGAAPSFAAYLRWDPSLLAWTGPILGLAGAIGVAVIFALLNVSLSASHGQQSVEPIRRLFDPDDVMLLLPVVIWCGGTNGLVLAMGLITPVAAIGLIVVRLLHQRHAGDALSVGRPI